MAADAQLIQAARRVAQSRVGLNVGAGFAKTAEGLASDLRKQVKEKAAADAKKSEELNKKLQKDFAELTVPDLSKLTEAESAVVRKAVNQLYEAHNDTNAQYQRMSRKEKRSELGIQLQNKLVNISRGIDGIEKAVNQRYELKTYFAKNKGGFSQDPYNLPNLEKAEDFNLAGITGFATDNDGLPTGLLFGKDKEEITNFTLPYTPEIVNEFIPELNKSLNAISKGGKINETTIQVEKLRLNNLLLGDNGTAIANAFHYGLKGGPLGVQKDFGNSLDTKEGKAEFVDFYVDTYVNNFGLDENAKESGNTTAIQRRNQEKIVQLKNKAPAPQKIGLLTFKYNAETKEFEAEYQGQQIIFTEDQLNEYLLLPNNETIEDTTAE